MIQRLEEIQEHRSLVPISNFNINNIMEPQEDIITKIVESNIAFREQFDRESNQFHKGDPTPVPLGGERIPESMQGEPQIRSEEEKIPDDPRYQSVLNTRSYLQEYKKIVAAICPAVEARLRGILSKDEEHKTKLLIEADEKIQSLLQKLRDGKPELDRNREYMPDFTEDIEYVLANANNDYQSKEEYGEFMLKVSAFNKKLFKEIQNLLQLLKDIKKGKV